MYKCGRIFSQLIRGVRVTKCVVIIDINLVTHTTKVYLKVRLGCLRAGLKLWVASRLNHARLSQVGSGCGSVGRAVASDSRDPLFESRHRQKISIEHFNVNCIEKTKIKKKRQQSFYFKKRLAQVAAHATVDCSNAENWKFFYSSFVIWNATFCQRSLHIRSLYTLY